MNLQYYNSDPKLIDWRIERSGQCVMVTAETPEKAVAILHRFIGIEAEVTACYPISTTHTESFVVEVDSLCTKFQCYNVWNKEEWNNV